MFQQRAESEGVQPNHHNNMPNSISEEPINRLPSNLGGSAHQSQLFYMPNSSLEEPIHQLPSNLGGSAHQSQLFYTPNSSLEEPIHQLSSNLGGSAHQLQLFYMLNRFLQLPSNLGGSAHQSQLLYMPNSSLEEPIHQLPSNLGGSAHQSDQFFPGSEIELDVCLLRWLKRSLWEGITQSAPSINQGGSAHQPQLSEAQLANELLSGGVSTTESEDQFDILSRGVSPTQPGDQDIRTADGLNHYRPLYIAAQSGDWKTALRFIEHEPNALTAKITPLNGQTVLHVAACCWQWEFILNLLEHITSPESIAVKTAISGKTVLHYVARGGSLKTAKALVQKNSNLLQIKDDGKCLPLFHSISSGNKKLVWYLSLKTTDESSSDPSFLKILRYLIISGYHDIALYFVQKYPHLAQDKDDDGESLLYWLARNPSSFFSGSNLGFLERWIYKFVHVEIRNAQTHLVMENMEDIPESILATLQPRSFATQVLRWFKRLFWKTIAQPVPYVEKVRDAKLKHEYAVELVNHVCKIELSSKSFQEMKDFLLNRKDIMASAVKGGIEEIVRALFQYFPDLIYVQLRPEGNILQTAIKHRQVMIVNIIKEIFPERTRSMSSEMTYLKETTTLHLAGELAPPSKLLSVPGAALQMQRELQWFKEVKEIVFPDRRDLKNGYGCKTPEEVFRRQHEELAKEGEKWMKDTANSCMVVSALIATVLFAAAFTVPGGNMNDKGIPIFLRTNAFTIFAISDALGLFSSLTSLLMFLAILTARYEIEDFLESLPKKLIIGLGSLFVAIASMIIAFGAALTIVLSERLNWVFVPVTLLASLPVVMFVWLQLPLFVQMVQSTYGASIFRPRPSRKFE